MPIPKYCYLIFNCKEQFSILGRVLHYLSVCVLPDMIALKFNLFLHQQHRKHRNHDLEDEVEFIMGNFRRMKDELTNFHLPKGGDCTVILICKTAEAHKRLSLYSQLASFYSYQRPIEIKLMETNFTIPINCVGHLDESSDVNIFYELQVCLISYRIGAKIRTVQAR